MSRHDSNQRMMRHHILLAIEEQLRNPDALTIQQYINLVALKRRVEARMQ